MTSPLYYHYITLLPQSNPTPKQLHLNPTPTTLHQNTPNTYNDNLTQNPTFKPILPTKPQNPNKINTFILKTLKFNYNLILPQTHKTTLPNQKNLSKSILTTNNPI